MSIFSSAQSVVFVSNRKVSLSGSRISQYFAIFRFRVRFYYWLEAVLSIRQIFSRYYSQYLTGLTIGQQRIIYYFCPFGHLNVYYLALADVWWLLI